MSSRLLRGNLTVLACLLAVGSVRADDPGGGKPAYFGFAFHYKTGQPEMRLGVCAVRPDTPAARAGIRLDDLITAVDEKNNFKNSLEVLEYLSKRRAGDELRLDILRGDQKLKVRIVASEATPELQAIMKHNLELAKEEAARSGGDK